MFGIRRRIVTEKTTTAMRPLIGVVQHHYGIPPLFWRDPFVIGFIGTMAAFHREQTAPNLSDDDKVNVLLETFTALSSLNGLEILRRYTDLATANAKDADFEQGADNATICWAITVGKLPDFGRVHYEEARTAAARIGKEGDRGFIAGLLMKKLWVDEVQKRFA